jgi:hypothetical protein
MLQETPAQYAANKRIGDIIYCIRNGKSYDTKFCVHLNAIWRTLSLNGALQPKIG